MLILWKLFSVKQKLHNHFGKSCNRLSNYLPILNKNHTAFAYSIVINLAAILNDIERKKLQLTSVIDILIVYSSISCLADIEISYSFYAYH